MHRWATALLAVYVLWVGTEKVFITPPAPDDETQTYQQEIPENLQWEDRGHFETAEACSAAGMQIMLPSPEEMATLKSYLRSPDAPFVFTSYPYQCSEVPEP